MGLSLPTWCRVHKWTSLICTAFLLIIALTGLPLIFADEIDHWLSTDPPYAALPTQTPMTNLDGLVAQSRLRYPSQIVRSMFIDDDEPQVLVTMAPSRGVDEHLNHALKFDARTAQLLKDNPPFDRQPTTFMDVMFDVHTDLFIELPGQLFMGLMSVVFLAALVSGVVLYAPFVRRLDFGVVRAGRASRLKWLDLHNLFSIVVLAWTLVIGFTGLTNELSTPLFALWQATDVKTLLAPYRALAVPSESQLSSVQAAFDTVSRRLPGMRITGIDFPGSDPGSPHHYVIWGKGNTPLTSRMFTPVLVDARSGQITLIAKMPWYLRMLELSRPLHFGDYAGLPLKIIWALLDLITLLVLGSGLYLWLARRNATAGRLQRLMKPA
jgi:uncharacterized iron-regulated membrane protein